MATFTGTSGDDSLIGGSQDDQLFGFGGNDTLVGGGGADTMNGGAGNDTYVVTAGDVLVDSSGRDTVRTAISWNLGAGLENMVITGHSATSSQGNDLDNRMVGNDADNYFNARGGNDTLIGGGGNDYFDMSPGQTSSPGNDSIMGGAGIDTVDFDGYATSALVANLQTGTVAGGGDGGAGNSVIQSIERFVGGAFDDQILGSAAGNYLDGRDGDDSIYGNEGADEMVGGAGNDTLDGTDHHFGALDANVETLNGGLGNDLYYIDNASDVITDAGGKDTLYVYDMDWTLAAGFENLTVNNGESESFVTGIGNEAKNILDGSHGWGLELQGLGGGDVLIGSPKADRLEGGSGNDTLSGGEGFDTVTGGGGKDVLHNGLGDDALTGGAGGDAFVFDGDPHVATSSVISDFVHDIDQIQVDNDVMNVGAVGDFTATDGRFYAAAGATGGHDATDRIVYNTTTGQLYYDDDGSGADAAILLAMLQGHPALSATDIRVI